MYDVEEIVHGYIKSSDQGQAHKAHEESAPRDPST